MNSKSISIEEKIKLPSSETVSRSYQPQQNNRKVIRILTVAVYVLCVSLAAIMLSLYYIFIWDPTTRPFIAKTNNCEKIVIPEKIAIRLLNSSEVTAEQFYKYILEQYRIFNQLQLQLQRQQYLQKQHLQLQQLSAANKFQQVFATATIIQPNSNDLNKRPITPTNGTFLLEPPKPTEKINPVHLPILGTSPAHLKRKSHRKHNNHHRRQNSKHKKLDEASSNPFTPVFQESYTSIPIPLILNSKEDKRPYHHSHSHADRKISAKKYNGPLSASEYEVKSSYLNPLLVHEFIFEKK